MINILYLLIFIYENSNVKKERKTNKLQDHALLQRRLRIPRHRTTAAIPRRQRMAK